MPLAVRALCAAAAAACLVAGTVPAARAETADRLLACVQARYGALGDLSARFTQESRVAQLGRPRTRAGRMYFQAKGKMRWEYEAPDRQLLVADGDTLWFYRPEQKQAIAQKLGAAFARQTPLLFLFGKGDFAAEFSWAAGECPVDASGAARVTLRPRQETPDLVSLELDVVPGECRLAGSAVADAFGNVTRLAFSEERANAGLDAALFRFTPPPGTEVVRP